MSHTLFQIDIPAYVLELMDCLEQAGFQAWAVGGCVRDSLLGKIPQDWDLCTNALPEEILGVFAHRRTLTNGLKHGTVTVVAEHPVEITTFRTEGGYRDHRHPDWVKFVPDLREDLARRDFTVNAMAYCPGRGLADPFGGQQDLKDRILRAVGDPAQRFNEDGLRILRGVRFATTYDLTPAQHTLEAMMALRGLVDGLSRERVFSELCKMLVAARMEDLLIFQPILAQAVPELGPMNGFQQHNPYHSFDVYGHTARVVDGTPRDLTLRWAALLHDVGKPRCFTLDERGIGHFYSHAKISAEMAEEILHRFHAPNQLTERVVTLIRYHGFYRISHTDRDIRRLLLSVGREVALELECLDKADSMGKQLDGGDRVEEMDAKLHWFYGGLRRILGTSPCLTVKDLAIDGRDLIKLGFAPGPMLGRMLELLLEQVVDGVLPNQRQALLDRAATPPPVDDEPL